MKSRGRDVKKSSFIDHLKVVKNKVKTENKEKNKNNYKKELEESSEDPDE